MLKLLRWLIPWYRSLYFKFIVLQLVILVLTLGGTAMVMVFLEKNHFLADGYSLNEEWGKSMVTQLSEKLAPAQTMCINMAILATHLEKDDRLYQRIFPGLLDFEGRDSLVIGVGIWYEPGAFEAGVERHGFFWSRNQDGGLEYLDYYNNPMGNGYHHEEWYIIGLNQSKGGVIWSRPYVDPYSKQSIVTCSTPVFVGNKCIGVATVDVTLKGLNRFFMNEGPRFDGYIIALDRNGRFISFPQPDMVAKFVPGLSGFVEEENMVLGEATEKFPQYLPLASLIEEMNQSLLDRARRLPGFSAELVNLLDGQSYQINHQESQTAAMALVDPLALDDNQVRQAQRLFIKNDPLLKTEVLATVFVMPQTYWKIIVVSSKAGFVIQARETALEIALVIISVELLGLLLTFLVMRRVIIWPITHMARQIRNAADDFHFQLDESEGSELGKLARSYNIRNQMLLQEISERTRAEQGLRESEEALRQARDQLEVRVRDRTAELLNQQQLLQAVLNTIPHAVFWKNRDSLYLGCNRHFAADVGLSDSIQVQGCSDDVLAWPKQNLSFYLKTDREILATGVPLVDYEDSVVLDSGAERVLLVNKVPLRDQEGQVCGVLGVYIDITERKILERQAALRARELEVSNLKLQARNDEIQRNHMVLVAKEKMAALGSLASGVAHEILNPLNFIINLSHMNASHLTELQPLFKHQRLDSEDAEELFTDIQGNVALILEHSQKACGIVKRLNELSNGRSGHLSLVSLNQLVKEFMDLAGGSRKSSLIIVEDFDPNVGKIEVVPSTLGRALIILLDNAIDAVHEKKQQLGEENYQAEILVRTRKCSDGLQISVRDNGFGIPTQNQSRIFEPFFTTKPPDQGKIGLGLSICHEMVVHGNSGRLEVFTEEGQFTEMVITLPTIYADDPVPKSYNRAGERFQSDSLESTG